MANESDRVRKRKLKTQHIQSTSHFTENLNESQDKVFNFRTFLQRILLLTLILIAFYRVYFSQWPFDKNTITRPVKLPSALSYLKSQHNILDDELFWGTYRPNLYFGVRHRSPVSIIGGLAWYNEYQLRKEGPAKFRHFCQNQDGVYNYGWFAHDGKHVGIQNISDTQFTVQTTWVKQTNAKNSWAAKIQVFPEFKDLNSHESVVALMFYFTYASQWIDRINYNDNEHSLLIQGHTPELGYFKILIRQIKQSYSFPVSSYTLSDSGDVRFGLPLVRHLKQVDRFIKLSASNDEMPNRNTRSIIFHTNCLEYPCELMISFHSDADQPIATRTEFKHLLQTHMKNFDLKFKNIFPQAAESGMSEMYKYLLSNMLGGMGYFHGQAKVQKDSDTSFRRYWPASLFSAVPSRSVFPRGFMWDEAFHHLLISRWDRQLSVEVLAYYLDMMNADGWMPREIILGYESEFHVPSEFVIQHNSHANPPAWILTVDHLLTMKNSSDELEYWNRTVDRLKHWLKWFQSTQHGKIKGSFRWRGRNSSSVSELNSKTLTSGLDDYPRASHPTDDERHVDLFCWLLYAERVMKQHFNLDVNLTLNGFSGLKNLHYYDHAFRDYGLHTENVFLKSVQQKSVDNNGNLKIDTFKIRKVMENPKLQYLPHIGYVSLYPFLLHLLPVDSSYLHNILDQLTDSELLWSNYGIRSLAKSSAFYNKRNTEHDPPYWRGAIWIHFNYLALRALHHYHSESNDTRLKERLMSAYSDLRFNVISNVERVFKETNTVWEQYNDIDGHGQYSSSFTGWSALVLLIKDELY